MSQRQSIKSLLEDDAIEPDKRQKLQQALKIRDYASRELSLPQNNSYTSYVDIQRDYVTWAVFAAEPLSLQAKTWCFPVVGCVPYRGYFEHDKVIEFSVRLKQQGFETYIAPIPAYSTLGWFSDPLLSSMLNRGSVVTAEYIFHELAHQQVYIKNDANFNEAFATAVGQLGVTRWLQDEAMPQALQRYVESNQYKREIYQQLNRLRSRLTAIYTSIEDDERKHTLKQQAIESYKQTMAEKLRVWNRYESYQAWLLQDINNARLNALSTYRDMVPLFVGLYQRCGNNFARFYRAVDTMRALGKRNRSAQLRLAQCE